MSQQEDVEDLTTMDRVMASPGLKSVGTKISGMLVQTGDEILCDRTQWLGMDGRFREVGWQRPPWIKGKDQKSEIRNFTVSRIHCSRVIAAKKGAAPVEHDA